MTPFSREKKPVPNQTLLDSQVHPLALQGRGLVMGVGLRLPAHLRVLPATPRVSSEGRKIPGTSFLKVNTFYWRERPHPPSLLADLGCGLSSRRGAFLIWSLYFLICYFSLPEINLWVFGE